MVASSAVLQQVRGEMLSSKRRRLKKLSIQLAGGTRIMAEAANYVKGWGPFY